MFWFICKYSCLFFVQWNNSLGYENCFNILTRRKQKFTFKNFEQKHLERNFLFLNFMYFQISYELFFKYWKNNISKKSEKILKQTKLARFLFFHIFCSLFFHFFKITWILNKSKLTQNYFNFCTNCFSQNNFSFISFTVKNWFLNDDEDYFIIISAHINMFVVRNSNSDQEA